jgi:hypothetical protein
MGVKPEGKSLPGIRIKAHRIFRDHRGPIVEIKFKTAADAGCIGVCLSDLNGERLFRILGKCGIPLVTAEARRAVSNVLQQQIHELLGSKGCAALPTATDFEVVPPLS